MNAIRKISLDKFEGHTSQVLKFAGAAEAEIIVYDHTGPIAKLTPYPLVKRFSRLRRIAPRLRSDASLADLGGVWKLEKKNRGSLEKTQKPGRPNWLSFAGLWKMARVSAALPFLSRF